MSKGMAMLIGLALAMVPAAGSAQEIGASFRVLERPAQPDLVAADQPGSAATAARIPSGWAYSVSRGVGGGAGSTRLATGVAASERLEVALPVAEAAAVAGAADRTVTWTFVPL